MSGENIELIFRLDQLSRIRKPQTIISIKVNDTTMHEVVKPKIRTGKRAKNIDAGTCIDHIINEHLEMVGSRRAETTADCCPSISRCSLMM